jgi:hypothetical protein
VYSLEFETPDIGYNSNVLLCTSSEVELYLIIHLELEFRFRIALFLHQFNYKKEIMSKITGKMV